MTMPRNWTFSAADEDIGAGTFGLLHPLTMEWNDLDWKNSFEECR